MAIHTQVEKSISSGMKKSIQESSMGMTLDLLQKYQYKYPIKSTVRELISNGIDSISEREVAKNILSGIKTISDYYETIEGEEYEDSHFDPTYYNLNWLSDDSTVYMTYIVGSGLEKDKVVITDNGVGLGSYRLEKYFNLGYSTKRLSKLPLGKFGIGGKAALSIGVDYFTMESRYNGRLYRFNIYSHTIDSIIPSFNLDSGQENAFDIFNKDTDNEYKVYYELTDQKNGVSIIIDAKKNHRQQYVDAVKSQLLYFPNIKFIIEDEVPTEVHYRARILYEDDNIILSDNVYWDKPHLLLNGVNYGYIDFDELELEGKVGNIGIKISPEEVDVNPSRESILWSDKTKETVLDRFNIVVDIASKLIQEELRETDYLKWIRACYSLQGKTFGDTSIVGRLARIVDLSEVKPSFLPEPRLKFLQTKVLNGLYVRSVKIINKMIANLNTYSIDRKETRSMGDIYNQPIYLMHANERASNRKDKYLYSKHTNFILVMEPLSSREGMLSIGMTEEYANTMLALFNREGEELRSHTALTWEYLSNSKDVKWYSEVEVPETFSGTDEEVDAFDVVEEARNNTDKLKKALAKKEREQTIKIAQMAAKERRKLEGKTLIHTPRSCEPTPKKAILNDQGVATGEYTQARLYEWQKIELPVREMNDWTSQEIYYGIGAGTDELIQFVAMLTRDPAKENELGRMPKRTGYFTISGSQITVGIHSWNLAYEKERNGHHIANAEMAYNCQHFYGNDEIKLIKASAANAKYMRDFQPIEQFFQVVRNNTVTMSNLLIKWNTARIIKDKLPQAAFLHNFDSFNPIYAQIYRELSSYVDKHYREVDAFANTNYFGLSKQTYSDLLSHLDKVQQFQEFVASGPQDNEIADMAQFMFGNKELQDGQSVDPEAIKKLQKVMDFCGSVGIMFNYMPILTSVDSVVIKYEKGQHGKKTRIPMQLEQEIKQYLESKGLLDYGQDEEELKEFYQQVEHGQEAEEVLDDLPTISENHELATQRDVVHVLHPDIKTSNDLEIPSDQAIMQTF